MPAARRTGWERSTRTLRGTTATRPYRNFSGADRGIMFLWWQRWEVDGMFCVLYSETDAFCEVLGAGGPAA